MHLCAGHSSRAGLDNEMEETEQIERTPLVNSLNFPFSNVDETSGGQ